ncbi:MAG TPA: hypothetical protein H9871_04620, partial [Candidatus Nesterenkonia stercoripullorum]|nr:hypothetical protein [Candidatus Nesterenkonia stercoripullorum]
ATLNRETIPVWLFTVSNTDFRASIAIAVLLNLTTWVLLLVATLSAGRFSALGRAKRTAPELTSDDDAAAGPSAGATAGTTPAGATTTPQKELR